MPEIKVGDAVLYHIQDKTYKALVLFAHTGQVDHLGEDDEPLVHLAFVAPERESASARAKLGYIPQVFIEYDVHHVSHEFTEQYKREHGLLTAAQITTARGNGEWEESRDGSDAAFAALLKDNADLRNKLAALASVPPAGGPAGAQGAESLPPVTPSTPPAHDVPVNEAAPESAPEEN
jgi:hypothetical protein